MLETLIQQSPLTGTDLEIAYRHEMTLGHDSEESSYWMVTRKADGSRLWLKAAKDNGLKKQMDEERRLLKRLQCQGVLQVADDVSESSVPYIAFRYMGERPCTGEELAGYSPLELLAFGLAVVRTAHCLETSKPPAALLDFSSAPLLVSPMLKRPQLLGLGNHVQTASEELHRQARGSAWQVVADALAADPRHLVPAGLLKLGEQWVATGPEAFAGLHQAFNAAAFELATQDL